MERILSPATELIRALTWNIESMILFRALQGLLGASMIPTVFTSSFHYFQGPRREGLDIGVHAYT
jgi:DHA2 family multidrug resistance protein